MGNWKKAGLIGLGAVLGVLLSLNFSAVAQREPKLPIPYEDLQLLSAVFGKIKSDYVEPVSDEKLIKEAINGMVRGLDPHSDFLDAEAFKDLQISTQGKFGGLGIEVGRRRRPRARGLADRGHARVPRRHQDRRPDRQDRRHRDPRPAPVEGRRQDARQARHRRRADDRPQGCRAAAHLHADARGNQRQERAREDAGARLRLHPHPQLPGTHRRGHRQGDQGLLQAGRTEGPRARRALGSRRAPQPGGRRVGRVPAQGRAGRLHRRPHAPTRGCA